MNFLTIGIKVLQLIGLVCSIIAAYWIPKGSHDNFIEMYPVSKATEAHKRYRGGVWRQQDGIITLPNYENIERIMEMLKQARDGYKLLAAGFIIQFIALALESISTALDP
jgi:hypothetical protein